MNKFYNLTKLLAAAMFRKDSPIIPNGAIHPFSKPGIVLNRMRLLVANKKINEAENLIFDSLDINAPVYAAIALEFYARISELSEEELKGADFSVEEIGQGIGDLMSFYKVKLVKKPVAAGDVKANPDEKNPVAPNVLADKQ